MPGAPGKCGIQNPRSTNSESRTQYLESGIPTVESRIQGYLPITWENRKFGSENQMARAIPIGKLQKLWAVIFDNVIFLLFLVCSADLDIVCSESSSHHVKFYSFNVYAQKFLDYE